MRIDVITIFPEYLAPLGLSLLGRAIAAGEISLHVTDLRDFTDDRHRTVDDTPYGGGPGMVMGAEPWGRALDTLRDSQPDSMPTLVLPTPSGQRFTQGTAQEWVGREWLVFACGRYEGIDARVAEFYRAKTDWAGVQEVSIGDYVLSGGEVATMVMVEATVRLFPGVLGNPGSVQDDSFAPGEMEHLLEGPVFTKPAEWRGISVPEVLLSGDHARIADWRRQQAIRRTREYRPDLGE
jgi:tRNA (guanine37-N1)-methyltransferase